MADLRKNSQKSLWATAAGGGAILLWSTTVAVVRSLSEEIGPVTAAGAVTGVSGVAGLAWLLACGHSRRQRVWTLPAKYLAGCGLLFLAYMVLLYLAIGWARDRQEVLEVALLNYLWPTLTLVLSLALLGQKASWMLFPGTLLALAGIFLVVNQAEATISWRSPFLDLWRNPGVYVLAVSAAVAWALYSNLTRRWAGHREEGAVALFLPVSAVVLLVLSCLVEEPVAWSRPALTETLFLGMATYLAYALWDHAMRHGNVAFVAGASYLTPLFSTVVSCIYLAVVPSVRLWVGCGVLILGSFLSWRSVTSPPRKETVGAAEH